MSILNVSQVGVGKGVSVLKPTIGAEIDGKPWPCPDCGCKIFTQLPSRQTNETRLKCVQCSVVWRAVRNEASCELCGAPIDRHIAKASTPEGECVVVMPPIIDVEVSNGISRMAQALDDHLMGLYHKHHPPMSGDGSQHETFGG